MNNEFEREIDSDEGRDIDWDSHLRIDPREAFYTHAVPCESCGAPVDDRVTAKWDTTLQVGPCCEFCIDFEVPNLPNCIRLWEAIENCKSVSAVQRAYSLHAQTCPICKAHVALPEAA
jgi:hypothetical protein